MPSMGPISVRIASAIFNGAERKGLAKGKIGIAKSPSSTFGGCSMTAFGRVDARIALLQKLQHSLGQTMFQMTIQEVPLSY